MSDPPLSQIPSYFQGKCNLEVVSEGVVIPTPKTPDFLEIQFLHDMFNSDDHGLKLLEKNVNEILNNVFDPTKAQEIHDKIFKPNEKLSQEDLEFLKLSLRKEDIEFLENTRKTMEQCYNLAQTQIPSFIKIENPSKDIDLSELSKLQYSQDFDNYAQESISSIVAKLLCKYLAIDQKNQVDLSQVEEIINSLNDETYKKYQTDEELFEHLIDTIKERCKK